MTETNAERLTEVKDYYAHFLTRDKGTDYVLASDLKWLIEQAERAQEWDKFDAKIRSNLLQEQQEEIKRLREALLKIAHGDTWVKHPHDIAKTALEKSP